MTYKVNDFVVTFKTFLHLFSCLMLKVAKLYLITLCVEKICAKGVAILSAIWVKEKSPKCVCTPGILPFLFSTFLILLTSSCHQRC